MYKKGFLLGLAMSSIMLVSLNISAFTANASPLRHVTSGSLYHRQPDRIGDARSSAIYRLDCFRRYYKFGEKKSTPLHQDAANYFMNLS